MNRMDNEQLAAIRSDLRAAMRKAFLRDGIKTLLWWAIVPTLFIIATNGNPYLSVQHNLPMLLALLIILLLIPLLYLKMWNYARWLREERGTVIKKKATGERVPRTDRNAGYVNRASDMVSVNVLIVTAQREDGKTTSVKMMGNHLFSLGQSYYAEGDTVERFAGARYFLNVTPGKKPERAFCLHCGYIGTELERRCSRCRCTLLNPACFDTAPKE